MAEKLTEPVEEQTVTMCYKHGRKSCPISKSLNRSLSVAMCFLAKNSMPSARHLLIVLPNSYADRGFETGSAQKQKRLLRFPESGTPEPLLRDKKIPYRFVIINDYYKMIYYVMGDVLRVSAFWDM